MKNTIGQEANKKKCHMRGGNVKHVIADIINRIQHIPFFKKKRTIGENKT